MANRNLGVPIGLADTLRTIAEEGTAALQAARQVIVNGKNYSYDAFRGTGSEMRSLVNMAKNSQAATLLALKSLGTVFQGFVWVISFWNCVEHGFSKRSVIQLDVAAAIVLLAPLAPVAMAAFAALVTILDVTGVRNLSTRMRQRWFEFSEPPRRRTTSASVG
jgi:hypothetical protein